MCIVILAPAKRLWQFNSPKLQSLISRVGPITTGSYLTSTSCTPERPTYGRAIDYLRTHQHPYRSLGVDPITVYWDALQKKYSDIFLRRNKNSKGYKFEFYDFQPRDWLTIKAEFKDFIRKLIALDMNIIVTARQKAQYADSGFMQKIGETFDGENHSPISSTRLFDFTATTRAASWASA